MHNSNFMQELPPRGTNSFQRIPYKRHIPVKGPSSKLIIIVAAAAVFYTVWRGQRRSYIITYFFSFN